MGGLLHPYPELDNFLIRVFTSGKYCQFAARFGINSWRYLQSSTYPAVLKSEIGTKQQLETPRNSKFGQSLKSPKMSHIEDIESKAFDMPDPKIVQDEVLVHAEAATAEEHQMKLREGLRVYPKAIFWSCLLSLAM